MVAVANSQSTRDALLHFDIVYRHASDSTDHPITSGDGVYQTGDDGGAPRGEFGAAMTAPAVPAVCNDVLVVKIRFVSGTSDFLDFLSSLTVP